MGIKGGKRPGAGRPKTKIVETKRNWASAILPDEEEREHWRDLLDNPKTKAEAVRFLSEHKHGKAPQSLTVVGDGDKPLRLTIEHIGRRDTRSPDQTPA